MSRWTPTKYKTTKRSTYNTALKHPGSPAIWFDPEMIWVPPPSGKRGCQQSFSDAASQTCLTLKVLFGMPLCQTTGFVESLLRLAGLDWAMPDYSTLCRRQKTLNVRLPYRGGKNLGVRNTQPGPRAFAKGRLPCLNINGLARSLRDWLGCVRYFRI